MVHDKSVPPIKKKQYIHRKNNQSQALANINHKNLVTRLDSV